MYNDFIISDSAVNNPIDGASFYNTNLNSPFIYLKLGNETREVFGAMPFINLIYPKVFIFNGLYKFGTL